MKENLNGQHVERLMGEGRLLVQSALTNLVSFGGILENILREIGDRKEFDRHVDQHFGRSFSRIADRLMNCHRTFSDKTVPVPLVPPDVLLFIGGDKSIATQKTKDILAAGEIDTGGKIKKLEDLTKTDLQQISARNKKLEALLHDKKQEIATLEGEVDDLKERLITAESKGSPEEVIKLKETIRDLQKELSKVKKKAQKEESQEKRRAVLNLKTTIDNIFISEIAQSVVEMAAELPDDDKELLRNTVDAHEQQMRQFKNKVGLVG